MLRATVLAIFGIIACNMSAQSQPIDLQAKCAVQGKQAFDEWESEFARGATTAGLTYKTISRDYQSHYNSKLKKCFVLVQTNRMLGEDSTVSVYLADAYEKADLR
jgi:hypothetical protein